MKQQHPQLPATAILCMAFACLVLCPSLLASPVQLRCNYQTNPLGIDTVQPHLSWQSDNTERNWQQSAYQIFVATRPELAAAGKADVWDSGRQNTAASVDIPYTGPALDSRHRYFWSVTVWDVNGHSYAALHPAWWEMGLLQNSDWTAAWIGATENSREVTAGLHRDLPPHRQPGPPPVPRVHLRRSPRRDLRQHQRPVHRPQERLGVV